MVLSIRKLSSIDLPRYRDARLSAFRESADSFSESFEDESVLLPSHFENIMGLGDEHFTVGVFADANILVGFATFKRDSRSKARHKAYIHTMYVEPFYRGKGIAKKTLTAILDEARGMQGLEQIHLWVLNPENSPARNLYLKVGWIPQGTLVKADLKINGRYVDAEYMTMTL